MTLSTTTNKAGPVEGDGANKTWNFGFPIPTEDDLELIYTDDDGTETTISSNFTVTGIGDANGGSVTYPVTGDAIAASTYMTVKRVVDLTQDADIPDQGKYLASVVEGALDYLMMGIQQLDEALDRSIKLPETTTLSGITLPAPSAGLGLGWNATADGLTNIASLAGLSVPIATSNIDVSSNVKTVLDAADYAAIRTALSLVVGTNVQAYNANYLLKNATAELSVGFTNAVHDNGNIDDLTDNTLTPDVRNGHAQKITIDANGTIEAPTLGLGSGKAGWMDLLIVNDATGPHSLTFGTSFEGKITGDWVNTDSAITLFTLRHIDGQDIYTLAQFE